MTLTHTLTASLVVALAALTLSSCSATSLVVDGSTVTLAASQPFTSFNDETSFGNTAANNSIVAATNAGFTYYNDASELVHDESFGHIEVVSEQPFSVRYTVNAGVTWSDGEAVDAADLLLAWAANSGALSTPGFDPSRFVDETTGQFEAFPPRTVYFDGAAHSGLQHVSSIPQIGSDGRSITLVYDEYFVDWELAFDVGLPAHIVAEKALSVAKSDDESRASVAKSAVITAIQDADPATLYALADVWNSAFTIPESGVDLDLLIGSGPYTITAVAPNDSVTLTANPLYSGTRKPHFETVVVRTIADPLEAVAALASGDVDVIAPPPSPDVLDALAAIDTVTVTTGSSGLFEHLDLQFSGGMHDTFESAALREAFLATVPVADIAEAAGAAPRASFLVPGEGDAPAVDLAKATRLVTQSGVAAPEVCILFDPANPRRVDEFEAIAASAAKAGFVVTDCSKPDWEGFLGVNGTYDAALFAWNETTAAVSSPAARLQSTSTVSNFSHYASTRVDDLLAQLAASRAPADQTELLAQIDAELTDDAYGIPLYQFPSVVAYDSGVRGIAPSPLAPGLTWNLWSWQPAQTEG